MKKNKIITALLILIAIVITSNVSFGVDGWISTAEGWVNQSGDIDGLDEEDVYEPIEQVAGILWGIGLFALIIMGVVTGIRFMISSSVEEKSENKKAMMPLFWGTIVVFGALTIWEILLKFFEGL